MEHAASAACPQLVRGVRDLTAVHRFSGAARNPAVILSASAKGGDAMVSETKVAALRVASAELFG